jgi:hypothetical protein
LLEDLAPHRHVRSGLVLTPDVREPWRRLDVDSTARLMLGGPCRHDTKAIVLFEHATAHRKHGWREAHTRVDENDTSRRRAID